MNIILKKLNKSIRYLFKSPLLGISSLVFMFLIVPLVVANLYASQFGGLFYSFIIIALTALVFCDVLFRFGHRVLFGRAYVPFPKIPLERLFVEPHPYLPFVSKRNYQTEAVGKYVYPLHKGKFDLGVYLLNNMRSSNGNDGGRDVIVPKPKNTYRINCIGASTTGNYIDQDGVSYSYPLELEKLLKQSVSKKIEVNNFGQGGYNSADLLIRFALQVIETKPDMIVIYHGYNDISSYLTPNFEPDYYHSKKNLAENYWKFGLAAKIPIVPLNFLNFLLERWTPASAGNSLLKNVSKGEIDLSIDPTEGLRTYKRNLKHIIDLCARNEICVVLSTYCHFLYTDIEEEPIHQLYAKIVCEENIIMKELADENRLPLVDNASLVPPDEKYYVDSVHFTPEGMKLVAKNIANDIELLGIKF